MLGHRQRLKQSEVSVGRRERCHNLQDSDAGWFSVRNQQCRVLPHLSDSHIKVSLCWTQP